MKTITWFSALTIGGLNVLSFSPASYGEEREAVYLAQYLGYKSNTAAVGAKAGYEHYGNGLFFGAEADIGRALTGHTWSNAGAAWNDSPATHFAVTGRVGFSVNSFVAYGIGGVSVTQSTAKLISYGINAEDSTVHTAPILGLGVQIPIQGLWGARAEFTHTFTSNGGAPFIDGYIRKKMREQNSLYTSFTYNGKQTGLLNIAHYVVTGSESMLPK